MKKMRILAVLVAVVFCFGIAAPSFAASKTKNKKGSTATLQKPMTTPKSANKKKNTSKPKAKATSNSKAKATSSSSKNSKGVSKSKETQQAVKGSIKSVKNNKGTKKEKIKTNKTTISEDGKTKTNIKEFSNGKTIKTVTKTNPDGSKVITTTTTKKGKKKTTETTNNLYLDKDGKITGGDQKIQVTRNKDKKIIKEISKKIDVEGSSREIIKNEDGSKTVKTTIKYKDCEEKTLNKKGKWETKKLKSETKNIETTITVGKDGKVNKTSSREIIRDGKTVKKSYTSTVYNSKKDYKNGKVASEQIAVVRIGKKGKEESTYSGYNTNKEKQIGTLKAMPSKINFDELNEKNGLIKGDVTEQKTGTNSIIGAPDTNENTENTKNIGGFYDANGKLIDKAEEGHTYRTYEKDGIVYAIDENFSGDKDSLI